MDDFEDRLKSMALRRPSEHFGDPATLAAYRVKWNRRQTILQRIDAMPWTSKSAAFVGLASIGLVLYIVFAGRPGASLAFGQVAEKLHAAITVSFDSVVTSVADGKALHKSRDYFMPPGKSRHEFLFPKEQAGTFSVEDFGAGKTMVVVGNLKSAIISSIKGGDRLDRSKKFLEYLDALPQKKPQQLGEKQVEGVPAKGFVDESPNETTTLWADATTGAPVRIEILHKDAQPGPQLEVLTNIRLDERLDPGLFSIEPPEGYQVRQGATIDLKVRLTTWRE